MAFVAVVYNRGMTSDQSLLLVICILIAWVLLVLGFTIYFVIKILPGIRELRETPGGQRELIKVMFPPRFHK